MSLSNDKIKIDSVIRRLNTRLGTSLSSEDKEILETILQELESGKVISESTKNIVEWVSDLPDDINETNKYNIELITDTFEQQLKENTDLLKEGIVYLNSKGNYMTLYGGIIHEDSLPNHLLNDLDQKIKDPAFVQKVLEITAARSHSSFAESYLMFAAQEGESEVISVLKALGADIHQKNLWGNTALMVAVLRNQWKAVKTLQALGSDIDERDNMGYSALMLLLSEGNIDSAKKLITLYNNLWISLIDKKVLEPRDLNIIRFLCDNDDWHLGVQLARHNRNMVVLQTIHTYQSTKRIDSKEEPLQEGAVNFIKSKIIKEAGHILGLETQTQYLNLYSEGNFSFESYTIFKDIINRMFQYNTVPTLLKKHYFSEKVNIQAALDLAIDWLEVNGNTTHQTLIDHHAAGKLTILPIVYPDHAFPVIIWNDVLIVCNRGADHYDDLISVFKIPAPGKLTKAFLEEVMPEVRLPIRENVLQSIRNFIGDISQPLLTFPSKEQEHGTCSFVNLKSSLKPILCFSELFQSDLEALKFDSHFLEPYLDKNNNQLSEILEKTKQYTRKEYKKFTENMRDQEIDKLITEFSNKQSGKDVYVLTFIEILKKHRGQYHNNTDPETTKNRQSAEKIFNALSDDERGIVLDSVYSRLKYKIDIEHAEAFMKFYKEWDQENQKLQLAQLANVQSIISDVTGFEEESSKPPVLYMKNQEPKEEENTTMPSNKQSNTKNKPEK